MLHRYGTTVLAGVGLVLFTGGCPLLDLEVEAPEVCLHYTDLTVPAADGSGSAHVDFVFDDLGSADALTTIDGAVTFSHLDLRATGGGQTSFDFLTSARASIASGAPESSLPEVTVVDCSGDACERDGATLSLRSTSELNAIDYLKTGSIAVSLDVAGTLPTHDWTVDLDVCMKGRVHYRKDL